MKRTPLKRHSERGLLRKEVGRLHLALLKKQRGDVCEFCGKPGQNIGRFHIIEISRAPRLEFTDENVLLSHWLEGCQVHYHWHHYGKRHPKIAWIENRLIELRGPAYEGDLMDIERYTDPLSGLKLRALKDQFQKELKELKEDQCVS